MSDEESDVPEEHSKYATKQGPLAASVGRFAADLLFTLVNGITDCIATTVNNKQRNVLDTPPKFADTS